LLNMNQSLFKSVDKVHPHVGCVATLTEQSFMDEDFLVSLGAELRNNLLPEYGVVSVKGLRRHLGEVEPMHILKIMEETTKDRIGSEKVGEVAKRKPFAKKDDCGVKNCPMVRCLGNAQKYAAEKYGVPKVADNKVGREWHVDGPGITTIYAKKLKYHCQQKRQTLFTRQARMFDLLSEETKEMATRLEGVYGPLPLFEGVINHCHDKGARMNAAGTRLIKGILDENLSATELEEKRTLSYLVAESDSKLEKTLPERREILKTAPRYAHCAGTVAKKNPYTGEIGVYAVPSMLECFYDPMTKEFMDPEESQKCLEQILTPGVSEGEYYAHQWEEDDLILFDNLKVMHSTDVPVERAEQLLFQTFCRVGKWAINVEANNKEENTEDKIEHTKAIEKGSTDQDVLTNEERETWENAAEKMVPRKKAAGTKEGWLTAIEAKLADDSWQTLLAA